MKRPEGIDPGRWEAVIAMADALPGNARSDVWCGYYHGGHKDLAADADAAWSVLTDAAVIVWRARRALGGHWFLMDGNYRDGEEI